MIEFLNANEGVIATIGVIVSIVIAILGFYINKNIKIISNKQEQKARNNAKQYQANDNSSINVK
ncbi:MAG: hypothetical protein KAI71_00045 [Candidatus Pacebacteria bacterium]|nr:hypothetical protein [Candidatus Paceibacterota bacterium]